MQPEAGTDAISNVTQPAVTAVSPEAQQADQNAALAAIVKSHVARGASWFYWIAGLSLINVFAIIGDTNFRFVFGLGISEGLAQWAKDQAAAGAGTSVIAIAAAGSLAMTGFFALCGWLATRPSAVAFMIGMVVFVLDSLVFVMIKDWIAVAFHAYACYRLWEGFMAARKYNALIK